MENQTPIVLDVAAVKYDVTAETILKMKEEFQALAINGIKDREGYNACDEARKSVKKLRIAVEDRRKDLKQQALEYGRLVDEKAKDLSSQLLQIESDLYAKTNIIDEEKERIKAEAAKVAKERLQKRIDALNAIAYPFVLSGIEAMDDEKFASYLAEATESFRISQEKLALEIKEKEEAARKAAEEKAAADRAKEEELAKLRAESEANKAKEAAAEKERKAKEDEHKAELKRIQDEADHKMALERAEAARKAAENKKLADAAAEKLRLENEALKEKARLEGIERDRLLKEEADRKFEEDKKARLAKHEKESAEYKAKRLEEIKVEFPTLELCWNEIFELEDSSVNG